MTTLDQDLQERIRTARALPSPPAVTARLIRLCEDPEAGISDIIAVLSTDSALTARLMRLANSAAYARRRRASNLHQVVTMLGFDTVLNASLSLALAATRTLTDTRSSRFQQRMWSRSVHTAAAAQTVAEVLGNGEPSDAFLAGLLQDIGQHVVDRIEPTAYDCCDPDGWHDDLVAAELDALGVDHAALGAFLLQEWSLPAQVVEAVAWSHRPTDDGAPPLAALLTVAGRLADAVAGHPDGFDGVAETAEEMLGLDEEQFGRVIEHLTVVLPEFSAVLDADTPDLATLIEMAEEAILLRQLRAQSAATELTVEVANLRSVAADLANRSQRDSQTGLANRGHLDHMIEKEFASAQRLGYPFSMLFLDLDDFKLVNDTYGHRVGDEVIACTASRAVRTVREDDIVGRFGGEEFIVLLPGADRESADLVAGRLVEAFADRPIEPINGPPIEQTVSIGVATSDALQVYQSPDEMLHAADVALYVAKRNGKNQFQRAENAMESSDAPTRNGAKLAG